MNRCLRRSKRRLCGLTSAAKTGRRLLSRRRNYVWQEVQDRLAARSSHRAPWSTRCSKGVLTELLLRRPPGWTACLLPTSISPPFRHGNNQYCSHDHEHMLAVVQRPKLPCRDRKTALSCRLALHIACIGLAWSWPTPVVTRPCVSRVCRTSQ